MAGIIGTMEDQEGMEEGIEEGHLTRIDGVIIGHDHLNEIRLHQEERILSIVHGRPEIECQGLQEMTEIGQGPLEGPHLLILEV